MSPLGQAFCVPRFVQRIWPAEPNAAGGRRERQSFRYEAFVPDPVGRLQFTLPAQCLKSADATTATSVALCSHGRSDFRLPLRQDSCRLPSLTLTTPGWNL